MGRTTSRAASVLLTILCLPGWCAAGLDGRVVLEMEYQGEYYLYDGLLDLPSPESIDTAALDNPRFAHDTWLPGNRFELELSKSSPAGSELRLGSLTGFNAERLDQEFTGVYQTTDAAGRWRVEAGGNFRESSQSFVGHGDWSAGALIARENTWTDSWAGRVEGRILHSRTRGDSSSFLYDYDLAEVRGNLTRQIRTGGTLEGFAGWRRKAIAFDLDGSYNEARGGLSWRSEFGESSFGTEVSGRDYHGDNEGLGRDFVEARLSGRGRVAEIAGGGIRVEAEGVTADYRGEDELYYDYGELELLAVWSRDTGRGSFVVGPFFRSLWDRSGGSRDFLETGWRTDISRPVKLLGFAQGILDIGHRNYDKDNNDAVEITSLSTSLLRTDYWFFDALILGSVPLSGSNSIDIIGDSRWEFHSKEREQIKVTFITIGFTRIF